MLGRLLDDSYSPVVRRHITTLTVARLCGNACYRFAAPFLAVIARGLHVSLSQIGVAVALAELTGLVSPLTARLVDRHGHRRAMVVGLSGVTLGVVVAAASQGLVMFAAALMVLGQSKVMFDLGMGSWIVGHVPYAERGRVIGLTETSWAFGLLIGVTLMGLVTGVAGWRIGYAVGAVAVVAMAGVLARQLPADDLVAVRAHTGGRLRHGAWVPIIGALMLMASSQSLFVTFGSWLTDRYDFTPAKLAALTFALGAGELLAATTSARRTDRWGKEVSAAAGAALMVPSALALAAWNTHLGIGMFVLVVAILGFEFSIVSAISIGGRLVADSPARGLGLMVGAGTLGRAVVSIPATRLYSSHGIARPALLTAATATCAATAFLAARHAER